MARVFIVQFLDRVDGHDLDTEVAYEMQERLPVVFASKKKALAYCSQKASDEWEEGLEIIDEKDRTLLIDEDYGKDDPLMQWKVTECKVI